MQIFHYCICNNATFVAAMQLKILTLQDSNDWHHPFSEEVTAPFEQ